MDEFQVQAVRKRIFHRFTKWYYQGMEPTMECPDAPELVALLQSAGFALQNIGFGAPVSNVDAGCRVVVECPTSGVRAELRAPNNSPCRCTRFSGTEIGIDNLQEQASFWHVTTSQERLNVTNNGGNGPEIGSSLLPTLDPARQTVIREVLQILQEELSIQPSSTPRASRHRLSSSSLSTIYKSINDSQSTISEQQIDQLERRASISCCENLPRNLTSETAALPPRSVFTCEQSASSSSLVASQDELNSTFSMQVDNSVIINNLKTIITTATDAISLIDPKKIITHSPLIRKNTFNVKVDEAAKQVTDHEVARKKPRFVPTPTPNPRSSIGRSDSLRSRAPRPSMPMTLGKPPVSGAPPKSDPVRRRTYVVGARAEQALHPVAPRVSSVATAASSVQLDAATTSKVGKSVALFKRFSNNAGNSKKKHPDAK